MNQTTKWSAGTAVLCLLIVVGAWFLVLSPQRSATAALKAEKVTQDSANLATQNDITVLRALAVDLPKQRAIIAKIHDRIPDEAQLPALVRSLTAAAASSRVTLASITPAVPAALGSTDPAAPSAGLQQLTLGVKVSGDYFAVEAFLGKLEAMERVFLVTALDVAADGDASAAGTAGKGTVTATISGRVFVATAAPAPVVVAAAGTPTTTQPATAAAAPAAATK